jgi:hypothetical protein
MEMEKATAPALNIASSATLGTIVFQMLDIGGSWSGLIHKGGATFFATLGSIRIIPPDQKIARGTEVMMTTSRSCAKTIVTASASSAMSAAATA